MLFRGCKEPGQFTSLISWFFSFFGGGLAEVKQPSGAQQSHILAKKKMGEMHQNKLPKQRGKKHIIVIFLCITPSLEDQKMLRYDLLSMRKVSKFNETSAIV